MNSRTSIFQSLSLKMQDAGFEFETEQVPHRQNRREKELKFTHPLMISQFEVDGYKTRAKKFYIKPLSDKPDCEIGLVTGKTSPLLNSGRFNKPNAIDTHGNIKAWVNRENDDTLDTLLKIIKAYVMTSAFLPNTSDPSPKELFEGIKRRITLYRYERNVEARKKCLQHYDCSCQICGFDFYKTYGEIGKNFIHVHHITPLSEINEEYIVDPKNDLIPVCPNCHAMLHRKLSGKEPTLGDLKQMINENI